MLSIGVPRESAPGEQRVALIPETVAKLSQSGFEVRVEQGAGEAASHADAAYREAGARVLSDPNEVFGADVVLKAPKVPYKETIKGTAKAQGKHKRQTGGHGQYGHAWLRLEPQPAGKGFEFVNKIVGGAIPREYIPAVQKGVREAMETGVLAGYPVVDVRVTLFDGSYHEVDSSELAFKIAGSLAFKEGVRRAKPILLEPVMQVDVVVPDEFMGDIIGDLNARRGRVQRIESRAAAQMIRAEVPLAEMFGYATTLRSSSQGRATHTMQFARYEPVPTTIAEEIVSRVAGRPTAR